MEDRQAEDGAEKGKVEKSRRRRGGQEQKLDDNCCQDGDTDDEYMNMLIRKGIESSIQVVDDKIEKLIQSIEEKAIQDAGEEDPRWSELDEKIESSTANNR